MTNSIGVITIRYNDWVSPTDAETVTPMVDVQLQWYNSNQLYDPTAWPMTNVYVLKMRWVPTILYIYNNYISYHGLKEAMVSL